MSQSTSTQTQTTLGIDINQLIGPVLMLAVFKGEDITPVFDALINSKITETLLDNLAKNIPQEYQDIVNVIKMAAELDTIRGILAAIKGQEYQPKFSIDKAIELVVTLQMMNALTQALGGGTQG